MSEVLRRGLLSPRSIAIVGASDDPSKTAGRPLAFLRQSGWTGRVYPINPRRETVLGERAWRSLSELPEAPDHALILTPKSGVDAAVRDCVAAGVKVASILAAGFSEVGEEGRLQEQRLVALARQSGLRLLGPSSLGFADPRTGLTLTANAAFADRSLLGGPVFAASHSGSLIGALASRGAAKGIGFAGLVSVGVEADLNLGEICCAALSDPHVESFVLYLESLRHARDLRRFALAAAAAGKAVVAYKVGRSQQAAELAQSHTGAMAGEDAIADAFFDACGIIRVQTLDGLLEAPALARRHLSRSVGRRPVIGVLTTTGGGAAMVVDQLGVRGVEVAPPSEETWNRLAEAHVEAARGRIVDLTLAGTKYSVMKAAIDVMTTAPEFDLVVAIAGSSARTNPELAVQPAVDSAGTATPLVMFAAPEAPDALVRLAAAGVPAFRTPESCADVISAVLRRSPPTYRNDSALEWAVSASRTRLLDELQGYELLCSYGVRVARSVGVPVGQAVEGLRFPVAVKALSNRLLHKSDVGGVKLGVQDAQGVAEAGRQIAADVRAAGTEIERVLVQEMQRGVGEVLIGMRRDPEVGPIVLLAPGGVLAELSGERSLRLAPIDEAQAAGMIAELPALRGLAGYRGRQKGDLVALAKAVAALSRMATNAAIVEAEVNPLIVLADGAGCVAVDAVVHLSVD